MTNPYTGENFSWTYQDNDWLATQTLGNGSYTTYTHNDAGQLTALVNKTAGGTTLSSFSSVAYDGLGNLTGLTASVPANTTYGGTSSWTYNSRNQMTQEVSARLSGWTHNYACDNAGNPTTYKGASRIYNDRNQRSGTGYTFDANGNPTTYNSSTLTYDLEDRLTAYGSSLTAAYRGDGLRAWKQGSGGSSTRKYFIYDGTLPIIELNDTGGNIAANTFGPTGLLARRSSGASTFYTFDMRGATVQRLDSSQNILTTHTQDAFGVVTSTSSVSDPFIGIGSQFGYYRDSENGMQLLTYRYYDPAQGRFLTRDPIGYSGGMNLYAHCMSSPLGAVDPLGLDDLCDYALAWSVSGYKSGGFLGTLQARDRKRFHCVNGHYWGQDRKESFIEIW